MPAQRADWSPERYLRFADERTRPARDLLEQVPLAAPAKVVDIGCGPGNSTALLRERFPGAELIGLDSSPAMLEAARKAVAQSRFALADANSWLPEPNTELVFANAIYQWVPEHLAVLPRVLEALPQGGVLAVQMPDNMAEPSHRMMRQAASDGSFAERLRDAPRAPLPPVRTYYDALRPFAAQLDIWHTAYNHVLDGPEAIVGWVRSTGLRPFLDPLDDEERAVFLASYLALIRESYPTTADGKVLLRFPRLFLLAVRG